MHPARELVLRSQECPDWARIFLLFWDKPAPDAPSGSGGSGEAEQFMGVRSIASCVKRFGLGVRNLISAAGLALLTAGLGGCGGMSDFSASSVMIVPGKYNLHGCQEIEANIRGRRARDAELEKLMAQASSGAGGEVVNLMVYRADY
jgi:hypothetical protein